MTKFNICLLVVVFSAANASDKMKPYKYILNNKTTALIQWLDEEQDPNYTPGSIPLVLFTVIDSCRLKSLKILVDKGANINSRDLKTHTSLIHYASEHEDLSCLNFLLEKNIDMYQVNKLQQTALFNAVTAKNKKAIMLLVDAGLSPDFTNKKGYSSIDIAKKINAPELFDFLEKP